MKIVIIASLAYSLVNFRGRLIASMIEEGHEVVVCAPCHDAEIEVRLQAMGAAYRRTPMARAGMNPFADLVTLAWLVRCLWRERPQVVLAYTQKPIIYGGIASRFFPGLDFYAMVSGLGHVFSEGGSRLLPYVRSIVSLLYRLALRKAKAVFVFNSDDRGEMLRHHILRKDSRVIQVPGSGVDLSHYAQAPLPAGPPTFLMIARLLRNKGLVEYVEAARLVRARYPEARFRLLGPLDENPAGIARETVERWHQEGVIDYLGETRDVRPYLADASIFVLPSWYREGLPRTILEAMAVGRGVITTDMPGCREPIVEGVNGFLVKPRSAQSLADAMLCVLAQPGLPPRMGRAARGTVEERYAVEKVNAMLLSEMEIGAGRNRVREPRRPAPAIRVNRLIDMAVAGLALPLAAPLMALIGCAIRLQDGAPVLFRQIRVTKDGRLFELVKFRTMTDQRDEQGTLLPDSMRTTPIGRFLRRSRLDELPQLWNILTGSMTLIGPRPLLPETIAEAGEKGRQRCTVPPGLTGWAQVNGNALLNNDDKFALDLWYIGHRSLRLDINILLRTLRLTLLGERPNPVSIRSAHEGNTHRRC
ncbi:sugar transferase [Sphingobium bisphenolivorans]|uniref:sugar transferase n=1 Tax=Sphingobium bisphenolivorans TaxID=1335760 RepID=UPI00039A704A|nr:sugar transferase [Sphingobium bisphenolivorans]